MIRIDKLVFGYFLTFTGSISEDEMAVWVEDSRKILASQISQFGVIVDMRNLSPLSNAAQKKMQEGQVLYKEKGLTRSAVIVSQGFIASQFKMIAQQTGIYEWERYIDASSNPQWEKTAMNWVKDGKDCDIL
jgi:hypothetical protein